MRPDEPPRAGRSQTARGLAQAEGGPARRRTIGLALGLLALGLALAGAASAETGDERVVVGLDDVPATVEPNATFRGHPVVDVGRTLDYLVVEAPSPAEVSKTAPGVRYVEPDGELEAAYQPNDPLFDDQYGPQSMLAEAAWDETLGGTDAAVCVVDSGLRKTHVEFSSSRILGDHDFRHDDSTAEYNGGHGTIVTGVAAAGLDNGELLAGMGNIGIFVAESMGEDTGYLTDVVEGIVWCADHDVPTVINLSIGTPSDYSLLEDAVEYAWQEGSLIVAAAGNEGCTLDCVLYPAAYEEAIAVSCIDENGDFCSFSSGGSEVEFAAPGQEVLGPWVRDDRDVIEANGTSLSAPFVAGTATLAWDLGERLTNQQLRDRLHHHTQGDPTYYYLYGEGTPDTGSLVDSVAVLDAPHTIERWWFDNGLPDGADATGLWHVDDACVDAPSGTYVGYHRQDACDYDTGSRTSGRFTLPVDLRGVYEATAIFDHFWDVEDGDASTVDVMTFEASHDGGETWEQFGRWSPADGDASSWQRFSQALDDRYLGEQILLRWTFDSEDSLFNDDRGWFIDNVQIHGVTNKQPVAVTGTDRLVRDDDDDGTETVTVDGRSSWARDGTIQAYEWTSPADSGTGATTDLVLDKYDNTVTLAVVDDDGARVTDTVEIYVGSNLAPTASAPDVTDWDEESEGNETITLNGTDSSDSDGNITGYEWRIDGETVGTSPVVNTTLELGTHTAQLNVTDNGGANDSTQITVDVLPNQDPDAVAKDLFAHAADNTTNVTLDGNSSEDPDGTITSYTWSKNGTQIATGPTPTVELERGQHQLNLSLEDDGNGTANDTANISVVEDLPPTAAAGPDRSARDPDADGHAQVRLGSPVAYGRLTVEDSTWTPVAFEPRLHEAPSLLVQTQTVNGGQKALYGEARAVNETGAEVRYCEAETDDACDNHAPETVAWLALPPGPVTRDAGEPLLEAGRTPGLVDDAYANASFTTAFNQTPGVFATTVTDNGWQDPSEAQVRAVEPDAFQTRHCEHDSGDVCDDHSEETNAWAGLSIEQAQQRAGMDAGLVNLSRDFSTQIDFDTQFNEPPLVFAQPQTQEDPEDAVLAEVSEVTKDNATVRLCEHESPDSCDDWHLTETVAWFAIDPIGAGLVTGDPEDNLTDAEWILDGTTVANGSRPVVDAPVGDNEYTLAVRDASGQTREDTVTVSVQPNQDPVPDAGADANAQDDDGNETEAFALDATDSLDPDGQLARYTWHLNDTQLAEGPTPTVWLPVGDHTLTLEVHDDGNGTATDTVNLTVEPNEPPVASGTSDTVRDEDGSGDEETPLSATDSYDLDGTVVEHAWSLEGETVATGADTTATLPVGTDNLTLRVKDNGGAIATSEIETEVLPNRPPTARFATDCVLAVCRFDASNSDDPDTYVTDYRWKAEGSTGQGPTFEDRLRAYQPTTVDLTVTDSGGAEAHKARTLELDTLGAVEAPRSPPDDAVIQDRQPPLPVLFVPERPHVSAAWVDVDATHIYVGLDANVIEPPAQTTAGHTFALTARPDWTPEDPTWGGAKPSDHAFKGLRFHATGTSTQDSAAKHLELQLVTEDPDGEQAYTTLASLEGALDPETDIVWWIAPRETMQVPDQGGILRDVKATVDAPFQPSQTRWADEPVPLPPGDREAIEAAYHSFDDGDGALEAENEQPSSEVRWDPASTAIQVLADNTDPGNERMTRGLPQTLGPDTNFTLTARWSLEERGTWQWAYPVYLASASEDPLGQPSRVQAQYEAREPGLGAPLYRMAYVDGQGHTRLEVQTPAPTGTEITFVARYNASSQTLELAILGPHDHVRAVDAYEIGTHAGDGFTLEELGVASRGLGFLGDEPAIGYADDLHLNYEAAG